MRKIILVVLSIALLFGATLLASHQAIASDGPTMHNCPQEGQWGTAVWTGDTADADVALGTCNTVVAAYAFDYRGDTLRWFSERPELNTLETLNNLDAVIALGGPAAPVVPTPTNIPIIGDLPDDCNLAEGLTVRTRTAGRGGANWQPKSPTTVEGTLITFNLKFMAVVEEFYFYCDGEFLQRADVPYAAGNAHIYTIEILVSGSEYEILPRQHEYQKFYLGRDADGNYRYGRLGEGGKIPYNLTCPVRWEWHDDTGQICPGYPDAEFKARRCQPGESPVEGETYCPWRE